MKAFQLWTLYNFYIIVSPDIQSVLKERLVLRVAEAAHCLGSGRIGWIAFGEYDAPRGERGANAVVAGLAVDVGEVVLVRVRRRDVVLSEMAREHPVPRPHVDVGRRREHAVEVEQNGIEFKNVHVGTLLLGHRPSLSGGNSSW